ncbi:MMPL family transporter [Niallia sp. FSL R7-0648]|uniref:MMPL family transporter n=1 Tax=Niallia sp. FSL R7-0648 TaxID=2954521 RepID=UPI0030FC8FB4
MKKLKSWRSLFFVLWCIITFVMLTTMPDMDKLVSEKGQIELPDTEQSVLSDEILKQMDKENGETYEIIAVFNSGSEKVLTNKQKEEITSIINELKDKEKELGITSLVTHLDSAALEEKLVSKDKTTILTQISVDKGKGEISEIANQLNDVIESNDVKTFLTGSKLIENDFENSTQEGVKKTEVIAVVFILAVLILVFRSPIVPIISLLTVGVSYLVSMGVIAQIVDKLNFPFSNFTQVFVVVVLFGIGTDYNILLYTRFKEELSKQENALAAVKVTFATAGKTVLYSGLAVLIGFTSLVLANFKLYQATSGVAIGVLVLLLVLVTLNPFFMVLLGKGMFYPIKKFKGHGDSRIWGFLVENSVFSPIISLVIVLIISLPFIFNYSNKLNFNDLWEVPDKYESKQGISVIEEHFPPGFSSPATLVIQSDDSLANQGSLQVLDELTEKIEGIEGVSEVNSPTRPTGDKIKGLYINDQADDLNQGLGDANSGIEEINEGLSTAEDQLKKSDTNGAANVQRLIDGTKEVENGVKALDNAMNQLTKGINSGATGAQEIEDGLASLNENVHTLSGATSQLHSGYSQLQEGLSSYDQYFESITKAIDGAKAGYQNIGILMNKYVETNPESANDPNIQKTLEISWSAQEQLNQLSTQLNELRTEHQFAMTSFKEANNSLAELNNGLNQVKVGVDQLQNGTTELRKGLNEGASGSTQIASKTQELQSGIARINNGQEELLNGLNDLQEKMRELQSGLSASTEGLDEVSSGFEDAQSYLNGLSESNSSEKFFIPKKVLDSDDFQEALNTYMSEDRKIAKMTIILDVNPYSREAMPIIKDINEQVRAELNGTKLENAKAAISGITARNTDLQDLSQADFLRTASIMLIGIALVLVFITKSISNSIFIVGSLILVYFTSLGIGELISTHILNYELLSWNVPFFSFIMIVALGVDYSIFLMMRYNEIEGDIATRIVESSRHIGGVVLSAALILGGTFAALIPSGVLTLIQVAIVVIVGLLFLSLIALPIFLPALIKLTNKLNRFAKK